MKTVLIAEDEPALRLLLSATLSGAALKLLEASDGQEALDMARLHKPDMILLDVAMPKLNGFQVCQQLKAEPETWGTKIILLTALAQETDKARADQVGADGFISKPFNPHDLLRQVQEALA